MKLNWKKDKLRIFALYEIIISAIVILSTFTFFFNVTQFFSQGYYGTTLIIAFLGLIAGFLLITSKKIGLYLSMIWSFLQMFNLYINGINIDLTQILTLSLTLNLRPASDFILVFNFLGAFFLSLLIMWRNELALVKS